MSVIQQQTWDEIQLKTWEGLAEHQWMDFYLSLMESLGQTQVQGLRLDYSRAVLEATGENQTQAVKVVFSPGVLAGNSELIISVFVSKKDYKAEMLSSLPGYYTNSQVIDAILNTVTAELRDLEYQADMLENSLFIDSVVENITRWEQDLGLGSDPRIPYDQRRARVRAKLQALGTSTSQMISQVAAAYTNTELEVIEDNANYHFQVKFTGIKGIPPHLDDLTMMLNEIKPAHLGFSYEFTYNNWDFLTDKTWQQVEAQSWESVQTIY